MVNADGLAIEMGAVWQDSFENDDHFDEFEQKLKQPLLLAVEKGHYTLFQLLLDNGASVMNPDGNGMTALHYAAGWSEKSISTSRQFLEIVTRKGGDIEAQDSHGCTALHRTSARGNIEVMQLLIDSRANPNAKNNSDETLLLSAILCPWSAEKAKKVRLLLERGADADATNHVGQTPLHVGSKWSILPVVATLLELGVDVDAKDLWGETALEYSHRMDDQDTPNRRRIKELLPNAASKV